MTKRTLATILQTGNTITPRDTLSLLPPRTAKEKKRRIYKTRTVSFYLHPRLAERSAQIRAMLDQIAEREVVSMDQIKFSFVDYGRHCYWRGEIPLVIRPNPNVRKLTVQWEETDAWKREIGNRKRTAPVSVPIKGHPSFSFRGMTDAQSAEMKREVKVIADKHAVTPGEVVLVLLEYAAHQYIDGKMSLKKSLPAVENKVDGWNEKIS
jgi:hypothetical protein